MWCLWLTSTAHKRIHVCHACVYRRSYWWLRQMPEEEELSSVYPGGTDMSKHVHTVIPELFVETQNDLQTNKNVYKIINAFVYVLCWGVQSPYCWWPAASILVEEDEMWVHQTSKPRGGRCRAQRQHGKSEKSPYQWRLHALPHLKRGKRMIENEITESQPPFTTQAICQPPTHTSTSEPVTSLWSHKTQWILTNRFLSKLLRDTNKK